MITIAGAGLAGLATAFEVAKRGRAVTVYEKGASLGANACSRFAGGMLAPYCEGESTELEVVTLGLGAAKWWADITPVTRRGTLVVAPNRDRAELSRFARRTEGHQMVSQSEVATLEPALADRFSQGLLFQDEAHLDPRAALVDLAQKAEALGVRILYDTPAPSDVDLDCTGMAADLPELRPVRGEMAILAAPDISLSRTVRLLHPRFPLYVVPRGDGVFMIGATMIESSSERQISVRSLSELLGAAYALHPGFGDAAVLETGAGLRPAFPDNLPRLTQHNNTLYLNGFYRHGFLLVPAFAAKAADQLTSETSHEYSRQRHSA
ncbi:FAD-dependent oxidoreductase [Cochlodiniinecator piscidefendens]|uniref:FAD-dependent oxidoreductase n=1 Tax=Cochlodiniinecator piscidefendens TaxID=2715756 RepID=UPI00140B2C98|nr:FAD-dependent oxidoreductase [Cochlodiniinecator piscidefendens]